MTAVIDVVRLLLFLFMLLLLARVVLSLVLSISRDWHPKGASLVATEGVFTITDPPLKALRKVIHRTVAGVALDIEGLGFNRAVARIYELTNALAKARDGQPSTALVAALVEGVEKLVQLINPMMPHLAETCWEALGKQGLVADASWPEVDPALLVDDEVTLPIQINGKRRGEISGDLLLCEAVALPEVIGGHPRGDEGNIGCLHRPDRRCRHASHQVRLISAT